MRVAIASIIQESNTFSSGVTTLQNFHDDLLVVGQDVIRHRAGTRTELGGFIDGARRFDWEIVPLIGAHSVSGGPVVQSDWDEIERALFEELQKTEFEAILLSLHGSTITTTDEDPTGTLLEKLAAAIGDEKPVVVTLDLHANITQKMVANSWAIVGYEQYPHDDIYETGIRGAEVLDRIMKNGRRPHVAARKIAMLVPAEGMGTDTGTGAELSALARHYEKTFPNVWKVSLFPVQPWMDIEDIGHSVVVVGLANDATLTETEGKVFLEQIADNLADEIWKRRESYDVIPLAIEEGIRQALHTEGTCLLIDSADAPSGGSTGGEVAVIQALVKIGEYCAYVNLINPQVVESCFTAGVGGKISISGIEGVSWRVRSLHDGQITWKAPGIRGVVGNLGRTAVISSEGVSVVVMSIGNFQWDPEFYRVVGLEPSDAKLVMVKSPCAYRTAFAPISTKAFVLDSPGACSPNIRKLSFWKVSRPLFPFDDSFTPYKRNISS